MYIRRNFTAYYISLGKEVISMLNIKRFDTLSMATKCFVSDGKNFAQAVINIDRGKSGNKYNPVRNSIKLTISKDVMTVMDWQEGDFISPIILSMDEARYVVGINELRELDINIPDCDKLSLKSIKKRLKQQEENTGLPRPIDDEVLYDNPATQMQGDLELDDSEMDILVNKLKGGSCQE